MITSDSFLQIMYCFGDLKESLVAEQQTSCKSHAQQL